MNKLLSIEHNDLVYDGVRENAQISYECLVQSDLWSFTYEACENGSKRIPPRDEWEWVAENDCFFLISLRAELVLQQVRTRDCWVLTNLTIEAIDEVPEDEIGWVGELACHSVEDDFWVMR